MSDSRISLTRSELDLVRHGPAQVEDTPAVFHFDGVGGVQALQGLLTNDVEKPGDGSIIYGALLTPKGMILADGWTARVGQEAWFIARRSAREVTQEIFRKSVPPRLAKVTDISDEVEAVWVIGERGLEAVEGAGLGALPAGPGDASVIETVRGRLLIGLGPEIAPWAAVLVGPPAAMQLAREVFAQGGIAPGEPRMLTAAHILEGWPILGLEIGERTLPQEVRFDIIGGVSYTKGCYVGQETVARLHFRGHTNRELRGLRLDHGEPPAETAVRYGEKEVGQVGSVLMLDDRALALSLVRREVGVGDTVSVGGRLAVVTALPFSPADING